ncbi:hypothetical protein RJ641_009915 [Dillenia turbinata]|uniref:protein disulfide-isomerase n=1 Tax=Dillenia turbinata TaxID=194707 RepID=A0AAN8Z5Y4_9MAGN
MASRFLVDLVLTLALGCVCASEEKEFVVTLDHSNFSQVVSKHDFIVVEFYAPCVLIKQLGPASAEIKSSQDAAKVIDDKRVFIVGVFPEFSGKEYDNFTSLAKKMRSDYGFGCTKDAKVLPRGESDVKKPTIRLLKPFDELAVDSQNFDIDAAQKFIEESSVPLVTVFDKDPVNQPYLNKFFNTPNAKAMLFLNFSHPRIDGTLSSRLFSKLTDNAYSFPSDFFVGCTVFWAEEGKAALNLSTRQGSREIAQGKGGARPHCTLDQGVQVNDEPVKVVFADNIQDMVFNSGKNYLMHCLQPWKRLLFPCKMIQMLRLLSCEKFGTLVIFQDATANVVPKTTFFGSTSGKIVECEGDRTKEDIIAFIQKNRDPIFKAEAEKDKAEKVADFGKDEL